ncbi:MAG: DNA repair protein RecO [Candidatus Bipolaricaulota bacterium]
MATLDRDEGVVLRMRDYAETDRILTVLTPGHGKLFVLAKGARRATSRFGGALDLANRLQIVYYVRRKGLHLVREVTLLESFPALREDLSRLEAALWGLGLADWVLPAETPDASSYARVRAYLGALAGGLDPALGQVAFSLQLLVVAGHRPRLEGCLACGRQEELTWHPERGGLLCRACGGGGAEVPPKVWKSMSALTRFPLARAGRLRLDQSTLSHIMGLVEGFWRHQLQR